MNDQIKFYMYTETIYQLKYNIPKKEFKEGLFDLVFKEAKNKEEAGDNKYIQIPKGLKTIHQYAFDNCKCLKSIIIPKSVNSIGNWAFIQCYNLKSIILPKMFNDNMSNIFRKVYLLQVKITYT